MSFLLQHYFSSTTIFTVSCLIAIAGLVKAHAIDLYTAIVLIFLAAAGYYIKDLLSPLVIFVMAICIFVYAIFAQAKISLSVRLAELVGLGLILTASKLYFSITVLVNIAVLVMIGVGILIMI